MNYNEEEQVIRRLRSQAERADKIGCPVPGRFVTGAERAAAIHEARQAGVLAAFDGLYPEAERMQVCFYPADCEPCFTAQWLHIEWNSRFSSCSHRSLLGSLMALGTDRSVFGDLIAEEDQAWLAVLPETAQRLPMEWLSAGRTAIRVTAVEEAPVLHLPKGIEKRDTVASLRLDSILASAMNLSRSTAAERIRAGQIDVDHREETRVDHMLQEGQLISVRGFGRIRLMAIGEPNRRDRIPVQFELFTDP